MYDPLLGEIRMFAGNYAPDGWAFCEGQLLQIAKYPVLFALIGTTYGGNGTTEFALPDLRGRIPIHKNDKFKLGAMGGVEEVTLMNNQLPAHTHSAYCIDSDGNESSPAGNVWASSPLKFYNTDNTLSGEKIYPTAISHTGGSQPHDNMMPSLVISFIISLYGNYPSRS